MDDLAVGLSVHGANLRASVASLDSAHAAQQNCPSASWIATISHCPSKPRVRTGGPLGTCLEKQLLVPASSLRLCPSTKSATVHRPSLARLASSRRSLYICLLPFLCRLFASLIICQLPFLFRFEASLPKSRRSFTGPHVHEYGPMPISIRSFQT